MAEKEQEDEKTEEEPETKSSDAEEDDIPLDLILKEEPFETIDTEESNKRPDEDKNERPKEEKEEREEGKCAFEHCGICKEMVTLGKAKLLGCLHTFCTECIERNERERLQNENQSTKVLCPVSMCVYSTLISPNQNWKNIPT